MHRKVGHPGKIGEEDSESLEQIQLENESRFYNGATLVARASMMHFGHKLKWFFCSTFLRAAQRALLHQHI